MQVALHDSAVDLFDRDAFERAWRLPTSLVIRRSSPHDFQDRQIHVWIDDEPLGKIRYGESITRTIEPGQHTVRVFNTLLTKQITVDAAPGDEVKLACGTGMPTVGWLMMIFLHVTYLRVWIDREPSNE